MNEFVTPGYLMSFTGMVFALGLIVQFTKGLVKRRYADHAVRVYAFVWALIIVGIVYWFQGVFDGLVAREMAMALLLALLNAMVVTLSAFGGYEVLTPDR